MTAGDTYKVMRNKNVNFYAYYEYDEDWDPNAVDENTGEKRQAKKRKSMLLILVPSMRLPERDTT